MNLAGIAQGSSSLPGKSTNLLLMKNSGSISLLALLITGCVSIKPLHVTRDAAHVTCHASRVTRYEFPSASHLFKATLDIKKHHLTGLLVIKRMETPHQTGDAPPPIPPQMGRGDSCGVYRIVFMNEVGMTFFDLEMKTGGFKVISCFESLNRKALIKIFETDFRMLAWNGPLKNEKVYLQNGTSNIIVSGRGGKYKTWQTYSPSGDTLLSMSARSTLADPVIMTFEKYNDGFPAKITIENPVIGMKLLLRRLVQ
jgi:hypothetical protein